jgi:predicted membrane-bound mannosyltransferase
MREYTPTHVTRAGRSTTARRTITAVALAAAMLLSAATASSVLATSSSSRLCGYFFKRGQDVIVSRAGAVTCKKATTIIKDFWSNKGVTQHGTSDADSYWTIKGFSGWRCEQSMGEGSCTHHTATASYQVKE